jgi:hypothetical protein
MMATVRNDSNPSRKTMISAWSMVYFLSFVAWIICTRSGESGSLSFALAGIADAEDLKVVKGGSELLLLADLALPLLEQLVVELDHAAAGGADQMVVVRVPADVLVVIVVLAEVDAADHARLHEQLERAVDRGARDLDALLFHLEEQLVGLEVVVDGEDLAHERAALGRELQSLLLQEVLEARQLAVDVRHAVLLETESQ